MASIEDQLKSWEVRVEKLDELDNWLRRAAAELQGVPLNDPRRVTFHEIQAAKDKLEKELEQIETLQEEALTDHLEAVGPLTLELQDGSRRVLAARPRTAGGIADLLPADLLRCWRVAHVFGGSVATPLEFGKRPEPDDGGKPAGRKRTNRQVVTGESDLFSKEV